MLPTSIIPRIPFKKYPNPVSKPPFDMPIPAAMADIRSRYVGAMPLIQAALTTYGTVCKPKEVPNYDRIASIGSKVDGKVMEAMSEGLLLNFYFFFPAMDTPERKREGDWSGISLLLDGVPVSTNLEDLTHPKVLLVCYFKKVRALHTLSDYLVVSPDGFRKPDQLMWVSDNQPIVSHPVVYISKGRHNCYYDPGNVQYSPNLPWTYVPSPEVIDTQPPPPPYPRTIHEHEESHTLENNTWPLGFVFPLFFFFACEDLRAHGKKSHNVYHDVQDSAEPGGPQITPGTTADGAGKSTAYPSGTSGISKLDVVYVDTNDPAMSDMWGYAGWWGAAELETFPYSVQTDSEIGLKVYTDTWGRFGGARRPNLAAWFLWNLYWDSLSNP